jgi:CBS domain-containing protein
MDVGAVMTRDVWTLRPEASLKQAAAGLVEHGVSGAPVVDDQRRVVGVLSEADIVTRARGADAGRLSLLAHLLAPDEDGLRRLTAETVRDAMTTPAFTVKATRPVHRAAALMLDRDVKRLPVVDDDGCLVGIVSRRDLVRAFARGDAAIAQEIEELLVSRFGFPRGTVRVSVRSGAVTLEGQIESEETAELLVRYVQRVLGVLRVDAPLSVPPRGAVTAG